MNKKILFVLHDADLMGAQMVLLHFLKWIKQNTDAEITILLVDGGPLQTEFELIGDLYSWRPNQLSAAFGRRIITVIKKMGKRQPAYVPYPHELKIKQFNVVYINTASMLVLAPMLKQLYQCPIIAHIHELSYSINAYTPLVFTGENISAIDHYIAACDSVARNLAESYYIAEKKISTFNEFIPLDMALKVNIPADVLKNKLGIAGKFIVGAAGQAGWRKGTDLFIKIASIINKKVPVNDIVFVWVGGQSTEVAAQTIYEIEKFSLTDKVLFTGPKTDIQNYLQIFDLFMLTSREDPFPLVALEAASLQKPIFCFNNSGGIAEIIDGTTGGTFDYGDTDAMANGIIDIYQQQHHLKKLGQNAAQMAKNYDVNIIAPRLFSLIQSL